MKRFLTFGIILMLTLAVGCSNVDVKIGDSQKFSQDEIKSAMICVQDTFDTNFDDCTLTDLWYDEEASNTVIYSYKNHGKGSINQVAEANIIVLHSNFKVGSNQDTALEPNSVYSNWSWTLIRDEKSGKWTADEWGYA